MKKEGNAEKEMWWQPALVLFGKLSGWIAGPIILAIFIGRSLDKKFQTEPWLFLGCVGFAFLISIFGIVHGALTEMKRIEKENPPAGGEKEV
jgi:F0F1-type ATP synthase assembly protein I